MLGRHLSTQALAAARLSCKLWALHLSAAASRVVIWPAMLREQRGSRASARLQRGRFSPALLLSGVDPSCEVEVAISELRRPSAQQLSQLWALLEASQARRVSVTLVSESTEQLPQSQLDGIAREALTSLQQHAALAGRLLQLDAHTGAPVDAFQLCHQRFRSLTKLHFDPSPAQLPALSGLAGLEVLCISLDRQAFALAGFLDMQPVFNALGGLRRLQDLTLDGFLEGHEPVALPPWQHLTRLVTSGSVAWSGQPKLLPAPLRASLQELYMAPVQAAEAAAPAAAGEAAGGEAAGALELPAVTQFVLSEEQMPLGVPAMPRLTRLHVDGRIGYSQLVAVLEKLPLLQVGRWLRPRAGAAAACRLRRRTGGPGAAGACCCLSAWRPRPARQAGLAGLAAPRQPFLTPGAWHLPPCLPLPQALDLQDLDHRDAADEVILEVDALDGGSPGPGCLPGTSCKPALQLAWHQ